MIEWRSDAVIAGTNVEYAVLLDGDGEPLVSVGNEFLAWYSSLPKLQLNGIHDAKKWLVASANIARSKRKLPVLPKGTFNAYMEARVVERESRHAQGLARTVFCEDTSMRADHVPTHGEIVSCMRLCHAGDVRIHSNPLACLQTGFELRVLHTTGVRGQVVRTATFGHVWTRQYPDLAGGAGMTATVMHNVRRGKTNIEGDGTHSGWMPSKNALLCPCGILGTCYLYRIAHRRETFPDVMSDNDGRSSGYQYKWLPLTISTERSYSMDAEKALLSYRPVQERMQNDNFNFMYHAAGLQMVAGDAVTPSGRHVAQQEFQDAGGDSRISNEALGYTIRDAAKDHYTPHIPPQFQMQRALFGLLDAGSMTEADASHLRVLREHASLVDRLVDTVLPELVAQEGIVRALGGSGDGLVKASNRTEQRREVHAAKRTNAQTHVREHANFLSYVRLITSLSLVCAASRPRRLDGTIDMSARTIIEEFGRQGVYSAICIRSSGEWLYSHPLFVQIAALVHDAELAESDGAIVSPTRRKTARAVAAELKPEFQSIANRLDDVRCVARSALDIASSSGSVALSTQDQVRALQLKLQYAQSVMEYHGIDPPPRPVDPRRVVALTPENFPSLFRRPHNQTPPQDPPAIPYDDASRAQPSSVVPAILGDASHAQPPSVVPAIPDGAAPHAQPPSDVPASPHGPVDSTFRNDGVRKAYLSATTPVTRNLPSSRACD